MPTKEKAVAFRDGVIVPTLELIGLASPAAAELLLGTALVESRLIWRRQMGDGPARGLFQMEMATHDDIWNNYLKYRSPLANKVKHLKSSLQADPEDELMNNDSYAAASCASMPTRPPPPPSWRATGDNSSSACPGNTFLYQHRSAVIASSCA